MVTIFSCPKPFKGHINIIQRNAIRSWTMLKPPPEIILMGDEEGVSEVCQELGMVHIPEIERNEYGTPLLSSIFNKGQSAASYDIVCYVNADIILLNDFTQAIDLVRNHIKEKEFFIAGRRWLIDIEAPWDFNGLDWDRRLIEFVTKNGVLGPHYGIDYFIFPKGFLLDLPPFAIGRGCWDNWLLYKAKDSGLTLIDASYAITAVHQNHDYLHIPYLEKQLASVNVSPEVKNNRKLCKGNSRFYTLLDSDYVINKFGLERAGLKRVAQRRSLRLRMYICYFLGEICYPYSYPFILSIKVAKLIGKKVLLFSRKGLRR